MEPGRVADSTPSGRATDTARSNPHTVSSSDAGSRPTRSATTGCPAVSERPRSPRPRSRTYTTNCSGRLRSRPSLTRISWIACCVAAGPAKNAAGSPGNARFRRKVTTITPTSPGTATMRRRPTSVSTLLFFELPIVELAVEPVLIALDRLLHRHVEQRLVDRHARHVGQREPREPADVVRVSLRVGVEARGVDELVHLGVLVGRRVEDGVLSVEVPEEEVLGIVEPAAERVDEERHLLLEEHAPPVRAGDLVDGRPDPDLRQRFLQQHGHRLVGRREALIERQRGLEAVRMPGLRYQCFRLRHVAL